MRAWIVLAALSLGACHTAIDADNDRLAATQVVVNERVAAGKMTEAEGRLAMANASASMASDRRRNAAILNSGGGVSQPVGGGTVVRY